MRVARDWSMARDDVDSVLSEVAGTHERDKMKKVWTTVVGGAGLLYGLLAVVLDYRDAPLYLQAFIVAGGMNPHIGWDSAPYRNNPQPGYRVFRKTTDLGSPSPDQLFLFGEIQRGGAATETERAHPGRSGFQRPKRQLAHETLELVTRCGQDGRAPQNRRGLRRFGPILIESICRPFFGVQSATI
jgi:hypothetical protein